MTSFVTGFVQDALLGAAGVLSGVGIGTFVDTLFPAPGKTETALATVGSLGVHSAVDTTVVAASTRFMRSAGFERPGIFSMYIFGFMFSQHNLRARVSRLRSHVAGGIAPVMAEARSRVREIL